MRMDNPPQATLRRLNNLTVIGDNILNWFLGIALSFFPAIVIAGLSDQAILPESIIRIVGIIFLLFASWQIWSIKTRRINQPSSLIFAALMAVIPVILLTAALIFLGDALITFWRIILWAGNIYMLFLSAWYLFLARRFKTHQ